MHGHLKLGQIESYFICQLITTLTKRRKTQNLVQLFVGKSGS